MWCITAVAHEDRGGYGDKPVQRSREFQTRVLPNLTPAALRRHRTHGRAASVALFCALLPLQFAAYTCASAVALVWQLCITATFIVPAGVRVALGAALAVFLFFGSINNTFHPVVSTAASLLAISILALPSLLHVRSSLWRPSMALDALPPHKWAVRAAVFRVGNHISAGAAVTLVLAVATALVIRDDIPSHTGASPLELRLLSCVAAALVTLPLLEAFQVKQHVRQIAGERRVHLQRAVSTHGPQATRTPMVSVLEHRIWTLTSFSAYCTTSHHLAHGSLGGTVIAALHAIAALVSWLRLPKGSLPPWLTHASSATLVLAAICAFPGIVLALFFLPQSPSEAQLTPSHGLHILEWLIGSLLAIAAASLAVHAALCNIAARISCRLYAVQLPFDHGRAPPAKRLPHEEPCKPPPPPYSSYTRLPSHSYPDNDYTSLHSRLPSPVAESGTALGVMYPNPHAHPSVQPSTNDMLGLDALGTSTSIASADSQYSDISVAQGCPVLKRAAQASVWLLAAPKLDGDELLDWAGDMDPRIVAFYRGIRLATREKLMTAARAMDGLNTEAVVLVTNDVRVERGLRMVATDSALGRCAPAVRAHTFRCIEHLENCSQSMRCLSVA
jgi:hypothetical protein